MTDTKYEPGVFEKDDQRRLARTPSNAVALAFDGFKRVGDLPGDETAEQPTTDASGTVLASPSPAGVTSGTPVATPRPPRRRDSDSGTDTPEA